MRVNDLGGVHYQLPLADGSCWRIKADDSKVEPFVERFASLCSMVKSPEKYRPNRLLSCSVDSYENLDSFRQNHPELVETGRQRYYRVFYTSSFERSFVFFNLEEFQSEIMQTLAIANLGAAFQFQMVGRGNCAPCHCALLEINGNGAIIGGPGDSGKTTCARRTPAPHRALADDYALLFIHRDNLLAQAMPTWSTLMNGKKGYRADCSRTVEVKAFFFLKQNRDDYVEPVSGRKALMRMNSILQDLLCVRTLTDMPTGLKKELRLGIFDFADRLRRWKRTYMLHAGLHGDFWKKMEQVLQIEK